MKRFLPIIVAKSTILVLFLAATLIAFGIFKMAPSQNPTLKAAFVFIAGTIFFCSANLGRYYVRLDGDWREILKRKLALNNLFKTFIFGIIISSILTAYLIHSGMMVSLK
jgi:hypothetical protein